MSIDTYVLCLVAAYQEFNDAMAMSKTCKSLRNSIRLDPKHRVWKIHAFKLPVRRFQQSRRLPGEPGEIVRTDNYVQTAAGVTPAVENSLFWRLSFFEQYNVLDAYPIAGSVQQCWEFLLSQSATGVFHLATSVSSLNRMYFSDPYWGCCYLDEETGDVIGSFNGVDWQGLPFTELYNDMRTTKADGLKIMELYGFNWYDDEPLLVNDYLCSVSTLVQEFNTLLLSLNVIKGSVDSPDELLPTQEFWNGANENDWTSADPEGKKRHITVALAGERYEIPYKRQKTMENQVIPPAMLPARGQLCDHTECFDLYNFMYFARQTQTWICPLCGADLRHPNSVVIVTGEIIKKLL